MKISIMFSITYVFTIVLTLDVLRQDVVREIGYEDTEGRS
jgi:hypothetical protein